MPSGSRYDMREISGKHLKELIEKNPCHTEETLQKKCMKENFYVESKCEAQTENYKLCKKFWKKIEQKRYREGKYPFMPPPDEREQIRKQHFQKLKNYTKSEQES